MPQFGIQMSHNRTDIEQQSNVAARICVRGADAVTCKDRLQSTVCMGFSVTVKIILQVPLAMLFCAIHVADTRRRVTQEVLGLQCMPMLALQKIAWLAQ